MTNGDRIRQMTEVRLIDANALFLKQKSHADLFKDSGIHDDIIRRDEATMALAEILNAPTIEAEPVRKPEMSEADRKKCEEWCIARVNECDSTIKRVHADQEEIRAWLAEQEGGEQE